MEHFVKLANGLKPLTIFANCAILERWQGPECAYVTYVFRPRKSVLLGD